MKSAAFTHYTDVNLTLIGLGLFLTVFIGSVIWVNLKVNRERYKKIALTVLDEGEQL